MQRKCNRVLRRSESTECLRSKFWTSHIFYVSFIIYIDRVFFFYTSCAASTTRVFFYISCLACTTCIVCASCVFYIVFISYLYYTSRLISNTYFICAN